MTDNTDNKPPQKNDEPNNEDKRVDGNASPNLSDVAAEALRLLREKQGKSTTDTASPPAKETFDDLELLDEEALAGAETTSLETKVDDTAINEDQADVTDTMKPAKDKPHTATKTAQAIVDEEGNTTNDLQQEALKAMQLETQRKREAELKARSSIKERSIFTESMQLKLDSKENVSPIIKSVTEELIVGRADNVTDYVPDIDLTPYGAYRLGLSRRHAVILREEDRVWVKDLNSRNGTFVNGAIVPGGGKMVIRDGDEIRFGNLAMRVSFLNED